MPFLEHDGVTRELPLGDTMVGGGSQADWRLQTINLAPRHFTVRVGSDATAVLTAYGMQIVELNGAELTGPASLAHGDEVIAGAGIFVYLARIDAPTAAAAPTPHPAPTEPSTDASIHTSTDPTNDPSPAPSATAATDAPAALPVATPPASPTVRARAYLVDILGSVAYPLSDDVVGIGRDPVNHIVLRDAATSRFHADVRLAQTGVFVFRSMGANGSTVNEEPTGRIPRPLAEGDIIRIGETALQYVTVPPAGVRVVTRSDVAPGPRRHQPTPIHRSAEPNTVPGPIQPPAPGYGRAIALIVAVLLAAGLAFLVWRMRGAPHP